MKRLNEIYDLFLYALWVQRKHDADWASDTVRLLVGEWSARFAGFLLQVQRQ